MLVRLVRRPTLVVALAILGLAALVLSFNLALEGPPSVSPATDLLGLSVVGARRDAVRLEFAPGVAEARYRAQEVLSGRGVNEAVGSTTGVTGSIVLDDAGRVVPGASRVTVDLTTLQSDNAMRDRYVQRTTLETARFPAAELQLTQILGLPQPLPTTGTSAFTLMGDLTVHGVTRPTTWDATATFDGGDVTASAGTTVLLTDFGMEPPRAGPVLSIEDAVRLELDVRGIVGPSPDDLISDPI